MCRGMMLIKVMPCFLALVIGWGAAAWASAPAYSERGQRPRTRSMDAQSVSSVPSKRRRTSPDTPSPRDKDAAAHTFSSLDSADSTVLVASLPSFVSDRDATARTPSPRERERMLSRDAQHVSPRVSVSFDASFPQETTALAFPALDNAVSSVRQEPSSPCGASLQPSMVREILGQEMYDAISIELAGEGGVAEAAWRILADSTIPDRDPQKWRLLTALDNALLQESEHKTERFSELWWKVKRRLGEIGDKCEAAWKESAFQYFGSLFPQYRLRMADKTDGKGMGGIVVLDPLSPQNGPPAQYYVKSHQYGLYMDAQAPPGDCDPAEIFVYKILEKIGIGEESHFFGDTRQDIFIATRDAAWRGSFWIAEALERGSAEAAPAFWKLLQDSSLVDQIGKFVVLSHILGLRDTVASLGNFGFATDSAGRPSLVLVDFEIDARKGMLSRRDAQGLLGYTPMLLGFESPGRAISAFTGLPRDLRDQILKRVIQNDLQGWKRMLESARLETRAILQEFSWWGTQDESLKKQLLDRVDAYAALAAQNFAAFQEALGIFAAGAADSSL